SRSISAANSPVSICNCGRSEVERMSSNGPNDDDPLRDATVVRPRGAPPAAPAPAPVSAPVSATPPAAAGPASSSARPAAARADAAPPAAIGDFLGAGLNTLVQAASPLLLL